MIRMDNESKQIHSIFMELQKEFAEKDTLDIQIRSYQDCAEGYRIEKTDPNAQCILRIRALFAGDFFMPFP